jgi:hypothetical protein
MCVYEKCTLHSYIEVTTGIEAIAFGAMKARGARHHP